MRHIIPTNPSAKELFPHLPSQQLRYYADIIEEAACADEDIITHAAPLNLDEIEHSGKVKYTEYKV